MKKKYIKRNSKGQFIKQSPEKRFWEYVNKKSKNECWEWKAKINKTSGYGEISINGKSVLAHRFSYKIHFGKIPANYCICHKCDNKICVNPHHLFKGKPQDNSNDMKNKNRQALGEKHPFAKLTEKQVVEIRSKYIPKVYSYQKLANEFNVSKQTIYRTVLYKNWKHI